MHYNHSFIYSTCIHFWFVWEGRAGPGSGWVGGWGGGTIARYWERAIVTSDAEISTFSVINTKDYRPSGSALVVFLGFFF